MFCNYKVASEGRFPGDPLGLSSLGDQRPISRWNPDHVISVPEEFLSHSSSYFPRQRINAAVTQPPWQSSFFIYKIHFPFPTCFLTNNHPIMSILQRQAFIIKSFILKAVLQALPVRPSAFPLLSRS